MQSVPQLLKVRKGRAKFRCIGVIDVDPEAILDSERLAGVRGTVLDLRSRTVPRISRRRGRRRTGEKRNYPIVQGPGFVCGAAG
jgi:hypothetical protein